MIDHYEGAIEQLRNKVASMVERQKQQQQKSVYTSYFEMGIVVQFFFSTVYVTL